MRTSFIPKGTENRHVITQKFDSELYKLLQYAILISLKEMGRLNDTQLQNGLNNLNCEGND